MKQSKQLLYFTASFPYGLGETWKANELRFLTRWFDRITVIPLGYAGNRENPKPLPRGTELVGPLFETDTIQTRIVSIASLLDRHLGYYLREFLGRGAWRSRSRFRKWLSSSVAIHRLATHPTLNHLLDQCDRDTVLYFYWGRGSCDIVPLLRNRGFGKRVVRMHRYDLFETENEGYIPYRSPLMAHASLIAPTSEAGAKHLRQLYPHAASRIQVLRCGTIGEGLSQPSTDGVLRICSCSYLVPVKRIHILIDALAMLDFPVHWTHLGDGPLMNEIRSRIQTLPANVAVALPGMIDSRRILEFFVRNPLDLFVNVSASEGVPFSIMEALSAGIPVFATSVGGSGEIVDASVGQALPPEVSPHELADAIASFHRQPPARKSALREAAFRRYESQCNAERLANELGELLTS
jgi:glycosyltransferase involved in cell wall biosynthesis